MEIAARFGPRGPYFILASAQASGQVNIGLPIKAYDLAIRIGMFMRHQALLLSTSLSYLGQSLRKGARAPLMASMAAVLILGGCASTATGVKQSAMVSSTTPQTLKSEAPAGSVLAVIRYPAVVETAARDAYYKAFEAKTIGGDYSKKADAAQTQSVADSVIVKSNYFALSLFKELAARLPEHSVLLSPHAVKLDAQGNLTSEPITQAESLPSVVSVDFATYSFPDASKMMGKAPLTFGDLVSPLVSVRTDHRASAPTQGLIFASAPLLPYAAGAGRADAKAGMEIMQRGQFDTHVPELDFIAFLSQGERASVPVQGLGGDLNDNRVVAYPVEKIKLDGVALERLKTANDGSVDPLERVFSDAMADNILEMINWADAEKAVMADKAAAIAQFDPSLAALTFVGSDAADYQARVRYAERLLEAQRKYLSVQSLRIFDGVHNGEMGAQMRDMITAEYKVLEDRRELARKQNQATALAVLGAVAAGAAIANGGGGSNCGGARTQREYDNCRRRQSRTDYGNQVLTNLAIQGAMVAAQQAVSYNQRSKAVGSNYLSSIVPALEEQTTITVDLIDSNETITAIRFEDLKEKLQTLYTNKQRALDTVATRCAYAHDGSGTGTWLGACRGGQANGSGAGVLRRADGTSFEYYGLAQNGMPNGPGLMIEHTPDGSFSLEGNFANGRADGPVYVSRPGREEELRNYNQGQDVGAGSAMPASPFNVIARP